MRLLSYRRNPPAAAELIRPRGCARVKWSASDCLSDRRPRQQRFSGPAHSVTAVLGHGSVGDAEFHGDDEIAPRPFGLRVEGALECRFELRQPLSYGAIDT
jgi:hypothetical protein